MTQRVKQYCVRILRLIAVELVKQMMFWMCRILYFLQLITQMFNLRIVQ